MLSASNPSESITDENDSYIWFFLIKIIIFFIYLMKKILISVGTTSFDPLIQILD